MSFKRKREAGFSTVDSIIGVGILVMGFHVYTTLVENKVSSQQQMMDSMEIAQMADSLQGVLAHKISEIVNPKCPKKILRRFKDVSLPGDSHSSISLYRGTKEKPKIDICSDYYFDRKTGEARFCLKYHRSKKRPTTNLGTSNALVMVKVNLWDLNTHKPMTCLKFSQKKS